MGIDEIIAKLRREAAGPLRSEQQIAEEQREAQEFGTELGESTLRFMRGPRHELYEPATETDVAATERAIGLALPRSFRRFATELSNGANLYQVQEVARVGRGNEQIVGSPRTSGTTAMGRRIRSRSRSVRVGGRWPSPA